jgi:hypothetical protein
MGVQGRGSSRGIGSAASNQEAHRSSPLEEPRAGAFFQFAAGVGAKESRVFATPLAENVERFGAIGPGDHTLEAEHSADQPGMAADRRPA